jgi:sec-independent protein translocase protein TatA
MLLPHLGIPELVIILVIVIIVFGVGKLPQIGGALGKGIREFRQASGEEEPANKEGSEKEAKETTKKTE